MFVLIAVFIVQQASGQAPGGCPPAVMALLEFMRAHEHDAVLDAAAMARLNGELVPAALAAWPALRDVLKGNREVYPWRADHGFTETLTCEQVFALSQQLMLQVGPPVFPPPFLPSLPSSGSLVLLVLLVLLRLLFLLSFVLSLSLSACFIDSRFA